MKSTGAFKGKHAPCGKVVDGERFEDRDDQALVTEELCYACGCVEIRHEYHDGSVSRKVTHHNGKVLVDELDSAE